MRLIHTIVVVLFLFQALNAQQISIDGNIGDAQSLLAISNAAIAIEGTNLKVITNIDGSFTLVTSLKGQFIISIKAREYVEKFYHLRRDG